MKLTRGRVLTIGPVMLVATCYAIAAPSRATPRPDALAIISDEAADDADLGTPLRMRCETTATALRAALFDDWAVTVHDPFVLAGDLSLDQLEQCYQNTIVPTARALAVSYFSSRPQHPITILLCSSDARFRECNVRLDNQERNQYSGLYARKQRRMIVNIASGDGTLAHELTHALAHADFATMPEWFDEGLASLHEECEFSIDELHLIGNQNWRHEIAVQALNCGDLRLLADVTSRRFAASVRATIDYAHVRSLCLYLQERGVLELFYRTCKLNADTDPTGLRSLCEAANVANPESLDDAFRAWLVSHSQSSDKRDANDAHTENSPHLLRPANTN